jgi:hypothetical protein
MSCLLVFELDRRLHRKIDGFCAAQDAIDIGSRLLEHVDVVDAVDTPNSSASSASVIGSSARRRPSKNQVSIAGSRKVVIVRRGDPVEPL